MGTIRPLDTFTLEFALVILFIFSACIIFIMNHLFKRRALQWISVGLALSGIGFLVLCADTDTAPAIRLFLSGTLICSGYALTTYSLTKEWNDTYKGIWLAAAVGIETVLLGLFTFLFPSVPYFIIASSIGQLVVISGAGYIAFIKFKEQKKREVLGISILHFAFALYLLYRTYTALQMISIDLIDPDPTLRGYSLVSLIYVTGFTALIISYVACDFKFKMKRHMDQLQQLTFTDPLTGVHNKRSVMRIMAAEKERISRYDTKCCIAIIDLDHFKSVNDTYGHLYGDHVLKTFAKIGMDQLRSFDTVARYGGEEFLLVLPETDLYQGMLIADRLRKAVSTYVWDKPGFRQTICVGVIEINKLNCDQDIKQLVSCADEALYVAKKNGRNHVEAAETKLYA